MSLGAIRAALEGALDGMSPALATAWENRPSPDVTDDPYQQVWLMMADPLNPEFGKGAQERGYLQVNLCYPADKGPGAAEARADQIKTAFYRGRSLPAGEFIVVIDGTPSVHPGFRDGDRWVRPCRIPFYAWIS